LLCISLSLFMIWHTTRLFNKSITTSATSGAGSAYPSGSSEFAAMFGGIPVAQSLVFCLHVVLSLSICSVSLYFICMFCRSLFVLLYFYFWPLCCLSFFDLRILIIPLWYLQTSVTHNY
jgi:hypothetical protein